MIITSFPVSGGGGKIHEVLNNQRVMLEYLEAIYSSTFDPTGFDWDFFFSIRKTGELFSTKFYNYTKSDSGIGEFLNDSVGKTCIPSTDKVKNRDDFENHNAFWFVFCNFIVDDNGVKIPTAIEGQKNFSRTGAVDVGVLTPPLYWGEEETTDGYIKHFSDSEHPAGHPELTLTLMPHCRDNKGKPMPYGIVPAYYAGEIDGKMYGSSGLAVKNFMSYQLLSSEMTKRGKGYIGAGSERSAYLKNFLWIKYKTLNSQKVFRGCTSYSGQYKNVKAETGVNYVTIQKTQAALFYIGATVSLGHARASDSSIDRGTAEMRSIADKVRVTKIEDDGENSKIYVDAGKTFDTTTETYISSMPLHSGQTDGVLGNDGYVVDDGKHSFKIQGVEDGIGAYFVSSNEVMNKETATKTVFYARNGADYSNVLETIKNSWKTIGEFTSEGSVDVWIGEETVDLETGASIIKTIGGGDSKGTGDRYYFGGDSQGLREYLARALLWAGSNAGLSCLSGWNGLGAAYWHFAACVS